MSIALMTAAFKAHLNSTHKFVLVALCDNANDQGECYPSVPMLADKTSLSDRAVQKSIAFLIEQKYLKRDLRNGRSNYYYIADPRTWFTPEPCSPPNDVHPTPERRSPPPPNIVHPTPERGSPITINEPSIESSGNHQKRGQAAQGEFKPMDALLEAGVERQIASDWLALRKAKKAVVTRTALDAIKREAGIAGMPLGNALAVCCERGWAGFKAEWLPNQKTAPAASNALGKAGQATAAAAQRLIEKMRLENEQAN